MRRIFTLFASFFLCLSVFSQTQTASPTILSQTTTTGRATFVGSVSSVQVNDGNYLSASLGRNELSQTLTFNGFGFSIPSNATISGVEVQIDRREEVGSRVTPMIVQLVVNNTVIGNNKAEGTANIKTSDEIQIYGTENDKWGIPNLRASDINSPNFGISFQFQNSNANNRFPNSLFIDFVSVKIFYEISEVILPVNFISFKAHKATTGTQLTWKVAQQVNVKGYEVERSNGAQFTKVGFVAAAEGLESYTFTDAQPATGTVLYRIKNVDHDGAYKYSAIIAVKNGTSAVLLKAFPIPAQNYVTLQHNEAGSGAIITLAAQDGRVVKTIRPTAGNMQTEISLAGLPAGMYMVRYDNGNGQVETLKLIKR